MTTPYLATAANVVAGPRFGNVVSAGPERNLTIAADLCARKRITARDRTSKTTSRHSLSNRSHGPAGSFLVEGRHDGQTSGADTPKLDEGKNTPTSRRGLGRSHQPLRRRQFKANPIAFVLRQNYVVGINGLSRTLARSGQLQRRTTEFAPPECFRTNVNNGS